MTRQGEPALTHYLRVLRHGLWLVLLLVVLAAAAAVFASLRQEKLYRASADVFLNTSNLVASMSNVQVPNADPVRQAATQADLAQNPVIAQKALALVGVKRRSPQQLLSESSVTSAADADILTFSVTDHSPQLARRLANAYAAAYTAYRHDLDTGTVTKALTQVDTRLAQVAAAGGRGSPAYEALVEKQQQLSTMKVLLGSSALVTRPAGAAEKTQPKTVRNAVLAGLLGLLVGVGLAFLTDALDTRVRSTSEIEELLELPLLARIPGRQRRRRNKNLLVMLDHPQDETAEAYRILATNLELVNLERRATTVMFTSAQREEGKSTTVANLGLALARGGKHVVVLDLDLRSPSLSGSFYLEQEPGVTHVALGRSTLEDALQQVSFADGGEPLEDRGAPRGLLEVLPVGARPPNPAEFAGSHALVEILAEVEQRADMVLIDAPPLLHLSDAMTLTSRVDGLVVVTRMDTMRRPMLVELHRVLATAPTAKLGVVVTGVSPADAYGDGYGYGMAESEVKGGGTVA